MDNKATIGVRRSEGAEFLVIGHLLVENVRSFRAVDNTIGYDLWAVDRHSRVCARLHVTSRWAEDYDQSFPLRGFEYDFLIHVALNRGLRFHKKGLGHAAASGRPEYFVFPVDVVKDAEAKNDRPNTVALTHISDLDAYRNNWRLIKSFLEQRAAVVEETGTSSIDGIPFVSEEQGSRINPV